MIKFQLLLIWSITLLTVGTISGWSAHQKVSELQSNPWSIVQIIGGE